MNDLWSLNPHSSKWTEFPVNGGWPSGRVQHGLTGTGSKLYLFGGYSHARRGSLGDLWAFTTATSSWAQLAAGPSTRYMHGFASSGGLLYVLGGWTSRGGGAEVHDFWSYDPAQDAWSDRTSSMQGSMTWPRWWVLLDVAGELLSVHMEPEAVAVAGAPAP